MARITESPFTIVFRRVKDASGTVREARFDQKADAELFWSVLIPMFEQGVITRARFWACNGPCLNQMGHAG